MEPITVLHCTPSLHPQYGGPARSVVHLVDSLAKNTDVSISLINQTISGDPYLRPTGKSVEMEVIETTSRTLFRSGLACRAALNRKIRLDRPSLAHSHGLWHPVNHWMARVARAHNVPLIIHPRGMLEPWALDHRALKKKIGLQMYQRTDLRSAAAFIATSEMEYSNIRSFGLNQPVAIIPNGVQLTGHSLERSCSNDSNRERVVLFLSRIHPVKGLLALVEAWARCKVPGWRLIIAGPDVGGYLHKINQAIERYGIGAGVEYVGEVEGEKKLALYKKADLFVLPTLSENFGLVVAEALSYGVPVITTRGAPWKDLNTYNCGWWIDIGVTPLVEALRTAMALKDDERAQMGVRGQSYVQRYDWNAIAKNTLSFYQWILTRGENPAFVRVD